MHEPTATANGKLSAWNTQVKLAPKSDDVQWGGEPRVTVNYHYVYENLPESYMPLISDCHDFLSHSSFQFFCQWDYKYSYWSIPLHPESRHYFAFTLTNMPQLQPTRVPQGSQSATFGLTECMKIMFGEIPPLPDGEFLPDGTDGSFLSLLKGSCIEDLANTHFYMDDIFNRFRTFDEGFEFLLHHFLPRIAWGIFKLSFKKLHLFCSSITALGIERRGGGISRIKHARGEKI